MGAAAAVTLASVRGEGAELSLVPLAPSNDQREWIFGPAKAELGNMATIKVPGGYRFADTAAAGAFLRATGNPVPRGLEGILAPSSGKWYVILQFTGLGYVQNLGSKPIDTSQVLKAVQHQVDSQNADRIRQGLPPIHSVKWEIPPVYDAKHDTLEWAIRAEWNSKSVINHTVRLFGRRGVLDATAVQPDQVLPASIPLKELVQNISFDHGERYADYHVGDKTSDLGVAEMIAGTENSPAASGSVRAGMWIGSGCVAGIVTVLLVLNRRKIRGKLREALPSMHGRRPASVLASRSATGSVAKPSRELAKSGRNGQAGLPRRKIFDYHKFYSDMMLQVSSGSPQLSNERSEKSVRVASERTPAPHEAAAKQAVVRANLELIASQSNLIEEQKRLLQEQSRLIEEKSKLIREKAELLEKQTELFQRNLL